MKTRMMHVDWPRVLGDLQYLLGDPAGDGSAVHEPAGLRALAAYLEISRSTIRRWLEEDAEPRHIDGELVIREWMTLSGKQREFLPVRVVTFSASRMKSLA